MRTGDVYEHWVDGEVFRDIQSKMYEISAKKEEIKAKKASIRKQISALPEGASRFDFILWQFLFLIYFVKFII